MRRLPEFLLALAVLGGSTAKSQAETIWISSVSGLFLSSFDSATPGTLLSHVEITGMAAGDSLFGIDFHPVTGVLFGYAGDSGNLYTLNTSTGAATLVGTSRTVNNFRTGMSFNGPGTEIRIVHAAGDNFRINPTDGTLIANDMDTDNGLFSAIAYVAGPTVYGLRGDGGGDTNTIGSIGGVPNSPESGITEFVGASGVFSTRQYNMDASPTTGIVYVDNGWAPSGGTHDLYTLDLVSGIATNVGPIGNGLGNSNGLAVQSSAVPEPMTLGLFGMVGITVAAARLWRRQRRQVRG